MCVYVCVCVCVFTFIAFKLKQGINWSLRKRDKERGGDGCILQLKLHKLEISGPVGGWGGVAEYTKGICAEE